MKKDILILAGIGAGLYFLSRKKETKVEGISDKHIDQNSHNITINDKVKFERKLNEIIQLMDIIQDKIINREKLTELEEKIFKIQANRGKFYGAKEVIKRKLI